MSATIEFYFDFSSSYSYIALGNIQRLVRETGCSIVWKPIALGAIFKMRNHGPPSPDDPKRAYIWNDIERCASEAGVAYTWPEPFPFNSIPAARIFYVIADTDVAAAREWALAVFNASFGEGRDCSDPEELAAIATSLKLNGAELLQATKEDRVKKLLKDATDEAIGRGVFGAPTFFVAGEMVWGADRFDRVERLIRNSQNG